MTPMRIVDQVLQNLSNSDTEFEACQHTYAADASIENTLRVSDLLMQHGSFEECISLLTKHPQLASSLPLQLSLVACWLYAQQPRQSISTAEQFNLFGKTAHEHEALELILWALVEDSRLDELETLLRSSNDGDALAAYLLQAMDQPDEPKTAPHHVLAKIFDTLAGQYNAVMAAKDYAAPEAIANCISQFEASNFNNVLDLGCGTGLLGPVLRNQTNRLFGVDLSEKSLAQADKLKLYDQLICEDMLGFLRANEKAFDLLVACDSFCYFGQLDELIAACFAALKPEGKLVFTLEEGQLDGDGYQLQINGRFMHSPGYVIEQLGSAGVPGGTFRRAQTRKEPKHNVYSLAIGVTKPEMA